MRRLFDRVFGGRSRTLARARSAELRGDLETAIDLFEQGGRIDEAERVRRERALDALGSPAPPVTATARREMAEVAAELEALGDPAKAAEAYARARDFEGQARALAGAGDVDRLELLLAAQQEGTHEALARRSAHDEFEMLVASGRRREAVGLAWTSSDDGLRARGRAVHAKRVTGPVVRLSMRGRVHALVLGERVVVGRTGKVEMPRVDDDDSSGSLPVASVAVSRRHLSIARRDGEVWVRDLGSHNGTKLRGRDLTEDTPVGEGIELRMGNEVPILLRPSTEWPGAMAAEVGRELYVMALGPARLGVGSWRLERVRDAVSGEWIELVTDDAPPAFANGLRLSNRVALLAGDALADERRRPAILTLAPPSEDDA